MKILIIGNAGSGKSTLSRKISQELGIPLHGLDKIVWKENWVSTPKPERQKLIQAIVNKQNWVIDGVSKDVLSAAERVYFLDIPTYKCIFNIVKRFLKNGLKTRRDLPNNCPEYIGVLKAIKIALIFKKVTRPWIISQCHRPGFIHIENYDALRNHPSCEVYK